MSKGTILLAHTSSSICDEVASVLRSVDYTVFCAYSRSHVVALLDTIQIDTVMYHTKLDDPKLPFGLGKMLKSENTALRILALEPFAKPVGKQPKVPAKIEVDLWPVGDNRKALRLLLNALLTTETRGV